MLDSPFIPEGRDSAQGEQTTLVAHTQATEQNETMHPARLPIEDLLTNCEIRRQRRSGPGGQHRNKVETGIFVEHKPTGIRAEATEQRSQPKNQELALFRIRVNLALQHRSELVDSPSELWKSRLRGGKIFVNAEHADFPSLLAECLDVLDANNWDAKAAAVDLGCSTTQLVRFLKKDGRGLVELNGHREKLGLNKLK